MSTAIAVYHGPFGRASIYYLDRPMVRHTHREGHLIFHIDGPAERLAVSGGSYELSPQAGVAVNPWEPHHYEPRHHDPGTRMLVVYINPSWFERQRPCAGAPHWFASNRIATDPPLLLLIRRLVAMLGDAAPAPLFDALLFEFTDACLARSRRADQAACGARDAPRLSDYRIRRSLRLLSSSPATDEPDLGQVAAQCGLSRPHFFKLFHDQVGVPPKLFWNTLRMERALSAVTETPLPITQIGLNLGFASSSSFSRFFTLNVGMAPTDYRRAARVLAA